MDAQDLGGFTGDNSGMGQGLAYVLPQSRTVGYFMQLANERAQERRQEQTQLAAQQQRANEAYSNHLYQFKTPEIANEYTKWLQPKFDDLLSKAADYHAATGQDPFTNPDFVRQINDLDTVAKSTHQANLRATAIGTALVDKSKNYTPESKQAATDWLQNYYKDPVGGLYNAPPSLEQRDLDLNDAIKLGHATPTEYSQGGYKITAPNRHNHVVQAQQIFSQPEFSPYLQSVGINTHVGDAFGQPNGHGGTIYPTDAPTVNAISDHILQNAAQPHFAATLQAAGIDPADPHAKDKLTELVQRQNAGYGKVYGAFADRLDANVENKKIRDYGEDRLALSEARLNLAREREQRQQQGLQATPLTTNYIEPARLGGEGDVKKWLDLAPKGQFRAGETPQVSVQNGYHTVTIPDQVQPNQKEIDANKKIEAAYNSDPEKTGHFWNSNRKPIPFSESKAKKDAIEAGEYVEDPYKVIKPGRTETLDPNNPVDYHAKAGEISSDLKIPVKAINDQAGGKGGRGINPGIHTGQQPPHGKVATMQQIQSKVGKPGYEGYTAQELADYYKAQGYTIK